MIGKEQLFFDPTNAANSDVVAGYVYGAGGTLITSTTVGADEGLDVNILNASLVVTATDFDIRDLTAASDSVSIGDGTDTLEINADGSINITDNGGSLTVDAVDLDIRDLSSATDSVAAWLSDGSGNAITSTGGALDVNVATISGLAIFAEDSAHTTGDDGQHVLAVRQDTLAASTDADGDYASLKVNAAGALYVSHDGDITIADGGNSITVDAVDLDIRDLTAASDSVAAWTHDGSGNAISSTSGSLDVNVTNSIDVDDGLANTALANGATSVGTTATSTVASPLANRKYLYDQNLGNNDIYLGTTGVSTTNGFRMSKGAVAEFRIGAAIDLLAISSSGTQDTRYLEFS